MLVSIAGKNAYPGSTLPAFLLKNVETVLAHDVHGKFLILFG